MNDHKFKVRGERIVIAHGNVIMVLAVLKLAEAATGSLNHRVSAIKLLRMQTGLGPYEAKCVVDLLAEKGKLDIRGEPAIEYTRPEAEYLGTEE